MVTSTVRFGRSILQTLVLLVITIFVMTQADALPNEQDASQAAEPAATPAKALAPISAQCVACHGEKGNSTVTIWPKIAGQHQSYLYEQLLAFKQGPAGGRNEPSMFNVVQGLSSQELADLAAFYAGQVTAPGTAKASMLALGQAIYRGGKLKSGVPACAACHGANGMGNELAKFPRLSGQHADYTANQLRNYKKKVRTNDANGIMQDIAMRLADEEIEAISSYVEGLY